MFTHKGMLGYSLIETMVGMAVGVLVLSVIVSVLASGLINYRQIHGISEIQEMQRTAFNLLSEDVSSAGGVGCNSSTTAKHQHLSNVVNSASLNNLSITPINPITIFSSDQDLSNEIGSSRQGKRVVDTDNATLIGDVLSVLTTENVALTVFNHNNLTQTIQFTGNQTDSLSEGSIIALNDCNHIAVLQIGNLNYDKYSSTTQASYDNTNTSNCSALDEYGVDTGKVLLGKQDTQSPNCLSNENRARFSDYTFHAGSQASLLRIHYYYLAYPSNRHNPPPSLYRVSIEEDGYPGQASEIIAGVENLRFLYGLKAPSQDTVHYFTVGQLKNKLHTDPSWILGTTVHNVSLRAHLLFRTQGGKGEKGSDQKQTYRFPNAFGEMLLCDGDETDRIACPFFTHSEPSNDRRFRRTLSLTLSLRNALL